MQLDETLALLKAMNAELSQKKAEGAPAPAAAKVEAAASPKAEAPLSKAAGEAIAAAQATRSHAERMGRPPLTFLRDLHKAYTPGAAVPVARGISAPPIVMGGVRRYAADGEIDITAVVTRIIDAYAKQSRGLALSSQQQALLCIAYPGAFELTDPLAVQALALVSEEERAQIRDVYEASLLEMVGYAQMKFGVLPGQHVTLQQY